MSRPDKARVLEASNFARSGGTASPLRFLLLAALTSLASIQSAGAQSGDPVAGRQKAQACAVCHGQTGISSAPDAPNLAGQPALYTAAQLRAYRSGARQHEVMSVMSKTLSDVDIDNLAAWFASLQIEVKPVP